MQDMYLMSKALAIRLYSGTLKPKKIVPTMRMIATTYLQMLILIVAPIMAHNIKASSELMEKITRASF